MNEAYCRDISVKTRSALEVKRRSGDFVGAFTIYGYVKVGDKHKSLEVDEYAANVVRDIFRKRLEGFSASHIADELNRLEFFHLWRISAITECLMQKVAIQTERIANGLQLQSSVFCRMKLTPEHWSRASRQRPISN